MTPIWDSIITGQYKLERFGEVPYAIVLTEDQWMTVRAEWSTCWTCGCIRPGERRINNICVALVDDSYTGPVVLGSCKKQ